MIIKSWHIARSRTNARLTRHLLHGDENEDVILLQGTADDIRSASSDARDLNRKYCVRHFIISPAVETSDDEVRETLVASFSPGGHK